MFDSHGFLWSAANIQNNIRKYDRNTGAVLVDIPPIVGRAWAVFVDSRGLAAATIYACPPCGRVDVWSPYTNAFIVHFGRFGGCVSRADTLDAATELSGPVGVAVIEESTSLTYNASTLLIADGDNRRFVYAAIRLS